MKQTVEEKKQKEKKQAEWKEKNRQEIGKDMQRTLELDWIMRGKHKNEVVIRQLNGQYK